MPRPMGLDYGLEKSDACILRKFRWLFRINEISASGTNSLPPEKGSRPSISFKEMSAEHLNETIYFPSKPEWKPVTLVLYELKKNRHPVFDWIQKVYNPCQGTWSPSGENEFKKTATLEMYGGCGELVEIWQWENIWPQNVEFGELDMSNGEYVTCDLTLRYDRAFVQSNC